MEAVKISMLYVIHGEIKLFNTQFGLRKFVILKLGSREISRTKDSGCGCNKII